MQKQFTKSKKIFVAFLFAVLVSSTAYPKSSRDLNTELGLEAKAGSNISEIISPDSSNNLNLLDQNLFDRYLIVIKAVFDESLYTLGLKENTSDNSTNQPQNNNDNNNGNNNNNGNGNGNGNGYGYGNGCQNGHGNGHAYGCSVSPVR